MEDRERSSREGSLSKATILFKDRLESQRLAVMEESNDTFLCLSMEDIERSSREGSLSKATILFKDRLESQRLAVMEESNDTFLCLSMEDIERSSREGSLSKATILFKDRLESQRLAVMEESDGSEKRSYAPSRGSDDADVVLAESFERRDAQADESSNLEGDDLGAIFSSLPSSLDVLEMN